MMVTVFGWRRWKRKAERGWRDESGIVEERKIIVVVGVVEIEPTCNDPISLCILLTERETHLDVIDDNSDFGRNVEIEDSLAHAFARLAN